MRSLFTIVFVLSLIAFVYFLLRFVILAVLKRDKSIYKKKLIVSFAILAISLIAIGTAPKSSEQLADKREKFGIDSPANDGTLYEQRNERVKTKESTPEKKLNEEIDKEKKLAEQKAAEERRIAEEQANAEKKAQEEARKQAEHEVAAEKKAQEEARRQAEQAERIVAEKYAFQDWKAKLYSGSDSVDEHWESLWQYTLTGASNGYMDAQTVFQNLRELEHKLIEDEMIFHNATIPQEMSEAHAKQMKIIKQDLADWVRLRRKGCENFRIAFGMGNVTPQVIQESLDIINQSDAVLLQSTAKLIVLEEEINNL